MMDTDAIYQEVCAYGAAKGAGSTIDAWDHIDSITGLLREADEEYKSLLATNEKLVDEVAELKAAYESQFKELHELKSKLKEKASLLRGCYAADHKQKQRIEELTAERDALKEQMRDVAMLLLDNDRSGIKAWATGLVLGESGGEWSVRTVVTDQQKEIDALKAERDELRATEAAWRKLNDTLLHQVLCCGVAASHPDATLTTRGAYAGKWNSKQAEAVRALRADRDSLRAELERIKALEPIGFVSQANMKFLSESAAKDWIPIWNTPTQDPWDAPTKASKIPLYALGSKANE